MDKKTILLISLMFVMIFVAGCQPDPRREADAYATRSQADQQAADAEQARQIQEQLHQAQMNQTQFNQAVRDANKQNSIYVRTMTIWTFGIFSCILLATFLLYSARSYAIVSVGVARATAQAAMVRANSIALDPRTRTYPLFLFQVQGSQWALVNPGTDSVRMLNLPNGPNAQMIATLGVTQVAGVLASEAARSPDPAGMAMISPPIVYAQPDLKDISELPSGKEGKS